MEKHNIQMQRLKAIVEEAGIKDHIRVDLDWIDPELEKILSEDPGGAAFYEDEILDIRIVLDKARYDIAEKQAICDELRKEIFERFRYTDPDDEDRVQIMEAYDQFKKQVEKNISALSEIRSGCLLKVKKLLSEESV